MALIAHWTLDAGALDLPDVLDVSGNARHGAAVGDVTAVAGQVGGGLQFGGSDDYVEVPHDSALTLGVSAFTLAAWIFPTAWSGDAAPSDQGRILAKGIANPGPSGGGGWTFGVDGAGSGGVAQSLFFDVNQEGRRRAANGAISLDTWQHVALRYDGGTLQFFVDGSPSGAAHSSVGMPGASTNVLALAIRPSDLASREFVGVLDDVRIYDEALSDAAIAQVATAQTVALGAAAAVSVGGQDLTATEDAAIGQAAVTVSGQDLSASEVGTVALAPAAVSVGTHALIVLPRPLSWCDQIVKADRFAPLAAPPTEDPPQPAVWHSTRNRVATLSGAWLAAGQVSPVNPFAWRTNGAAWIDVKHSVLAPFARGVTIWLELVVHDIASRAVILTTGGGSADEGSFSIEVQPPANGSLIRAWFVEGGQILYFGGSAPLGGGIAGSKITPGAPTAIALTMGENGAALAVNGETLATLATVGTARAVTKRFGAWIDGSAQIAATLGGLRFYGALDEHQIRLMYDSRIDWWSRLAFGVVAPQVGAISVGGQALGVAADEIVPIAPAAVSVGGQDLDASVGDAAVEIAPAAVSVGGQGVAIVQTVDVGGPAAVSVAGQDLTVVEPAPIAHASTATAYVSSGSSATHTLSGYAVSATNTNRYMVAYSARNGGEDPTGVTYNGVAMTFAVGVDRASTWYMLDAALPTDGSGHDIVSTYAGAVSLVTIGAVEYENVGQAGPSDTDTAFTSGGGLATTTVTVPTDGIAIKVAGNSGNQIFVDGGGETSRYSYAGGTSQCGITLTDKIGVSGSTNMTSDSPGAPVTDQATIALAPVT